MKIVIDFETRSPCDLKSAGAWAYSRNPETEILCMSWTYATLESEIFIPQWINNFQPPETWRSIVADPFSVFVAHNAFFEQSIYQNILVRRYGWPEIPIARWRDTMAVACYHAIPRSLSGASSTLKTAPKDASGARLMLRMCKPRRPTRGNPARYHAKIDDVRRLAEYCAADVIAERDLDAALGDLPTGEAAVWQLDQRINRRGFAVDVETARAALAIVGQLYDAGCAELDALTLGEITTPGQHARIKAFALGLGYDVETDKAGIEIALEREDLPPTLRRVLEIRQELGRASTAKYEAIVNSADPDDHRIRGALLYHGASTGRWTGSGFQPQNLPKAEPPADVETLIALVRAGDLDGLREHGSPGHILSSLLRAMITAPPGRVLVAADWSGIEACGLIWATRDDAALGVLRAGGVKNLYPEMAATIYGAPVAGVTKEQRQIGKIAILGLGYGMGAQKFQQTCAAWGVDISGTFAEKVVETYRAKFANVVKLWGRMEAAATHTVKTGGRSGVDAFGFAMVDQWLVMTLPSGREIRYFDPRIDDGRLTYMTVVTGGKWARVDTWGGKLVENAVQGLCACLLRGALSDLDAEGWPVVLSVHDEIVCEVDEEVPDTAQRLIDIMTRVPKWAAGFPLAAEGWREKRFRK